MLCVNLIDFMHFSLLVSNSEFPKRSVSLQLFFDTESQFKSNQQNKHTEWIKKPYKNGRRCFFLFVVKKIWFYFGIVFIWIRFPINYSWKLFECIFSRENKSIRCVSAFSPFSPMNVLLMQFGNSLSVTKVSNRIANYDFWNTRAPDRKFNWDTNGGALATLKYCELYSINLHKFYFPHKTNCKTNPYGMKLFVLKFSFFWFPFHVFKLLFFLFNW